MNRALALCVIAVSSVACSRASEPAPSAAPMATAEQPVPQRAEAAPLKPLAKKKFGGEITEKTSTPLAELLRHPAQFAAKTVRTEGVVSAVCKNKGCWMQLADDAGLAHVRMAGHSFFVPRDSAGHRAIVQGKVVSAPKEDECSEEAREQTGQMAKVELEATGVEFVD